MPYGARVVARCYNGLWNPDPHTRPIHPERPNFVIVCVHGDWSGFRTYAECLAQKIPPARDNYYWIEER